ncbi:MAG: YvcK family protein [Acidobacteria bacterium]|nr:YvcK family protein [Acidobacteriota bacterium]
MNALTRSSMLRVVLFSGGRGASALLKLLAADRSVYLTVAINGYDDGASTGEVRRFLGDSLGPSDFRKNASRLALQLGTCPPALVEAIDLRLLRGTCPDPVATARQAVTAHPAVNARLDAFIAELEASKRPFDFSDCCVGNLVFAGSFLLNRRNFNAALDDFCGLLGLPPGTVENVTDGTNAFLVATASDGSVLSSEHEIVDGTRRNRIGEIYLIDRPLSDIERRELAAAGTSLARAVFERRRAAIRLNPRLASRIADADLIIFAPGTQHSSLFPSYMTPGLGGAIARNLRAIKLLVTNLQTDAEITDSSAVDIIERALFHLREKGTRCVPTPCLITHYLVNDPRHEEPARPHVPLGQIETLEDPRLVRIANYEDGVTGRHDAAKVLEPFMRAFRERREPPRVAVLLHDARSVNAVAQTILELVRGGVGDLPIDVTVLHLGEPFDGSFTGALPFGVQAVTAASDLREAIETGGFDYVVLFESSGRYRGEDVAGIATHLLLGRLDAVWGSRRLSTRDVEESYRFRYRRNILLGAISYVGSHLLSLACLLLFGRYISDTLSGLRAVRTADVLALDAPLSGGRTNQYLLVDLLRHQRDILEVPVQFLPLGTERDRRGRILDGLHSLWVLFNGRLRPGRPSPAPERAASVADPQVPAVTLLSRGAAVALTGSLAIALAALGGWSAYFYALLFLLATLSGLPLGFALFGRRHAAGWIAGTLFGYTITATAFWAVDYLRLASTQTFVAAWAIATAVTWAGCRRMRTPAVQPPLWRRADTAALLLLLLLVPALLTLPLSRVGTKDAEGNRQYRAYFTADFVWHTALVAELSKHERSPRNPYLASAPLHYYWTYFLVPATIASETLVEAQDALKVNAMAAGLLFVAAIFLAAWTWVPHRPFTVAAAVFLTIVAASAEGLGGSAALLHLGRPLVELRDLNIEALTSWAFQGLRIDGLRRSMWYNPQHSTACAVSLIALLVATTAGVRAGRRAILLAGAALAAGVMLNPFIGVVFSVIYAAAVLADAARSRSGVQPLLPHAAVAGLVLAALGWCVLNQVLDRVPDALRIGWFEPARNAPVLTLLLSLGPILVPIAIALRPRRSMSLERVWPPLAGMILSLLLMFFLSLRVDLFWVGFRTGQIFQVLAPALVARGLIEIERSRRRLAAVALGAGVLAVGSPTTIIDTYNAQDVSNRAMGPGFHWTVLLTPPAQEALAWIRTNTPADAVVQAEPVIRGRETWSLIPSFAQRRMAAGLPISLMRTPEYEEKSRQAREIYASGDAHAAWRSAKALGIHYLYADTTERRAYEGVSKFDNHPELFSPVFRNAEVRIYAVR